MSDEINLQRLRSEVRSLYKKIDTLSRGNASLRAKLEKIQAVVNEQAEDDGLWLLRFRRHSVLGLRLQQREDQVVRWDDE